MTSISQTLGMPSLTDVKTVTSQDEYSPEVGHESHYVTQQQQQYFTRLMPGNEQQPPVTSLDASDYPHNVSITSLHQQAATSGDASIAQTHLASGVGVATSNFSVNHLLELEGMPKPYYMQNMLTNSLHSLGSLSAGLPPHHQQPPPPPQTHDVTGGSVMHMTSPVGGVTQQHDNNNSKHLQHLSQHHNMSDTCPGSDRMTPPSQQFTPNPSLDRSSGNSSLFFYSDLHICHNSLHFLPSKPYSFFFLD